MSANERFSAEQVARLARIQLTEEQTESIQHQLDDVLRLVGQMDELDLSDVEPFFGLVEPNAIRPDDVIESAPRENILANASDHDGQHFKVPPVFK